MLKVTASTIWGTRIGEAGLYERWRYRALPHQIQYDVLQAPRFPFQIKASAAPPASVSIAALSLATQITGVTGA